MRVSKSYTMIICLLVGLSNVPSIVLAEDCKAILAKLPNHSAGSSDQAQMVANFEKQCKARPNADDPNVFNQCMTAGMRSMAVSGNYVAAEKMARMECDAGHDELSKTFLGMIMNNQNASEADKAAAQEAINSKNQ